MSLETHRQEVEQVFQLVKKEFGNQLLALKFRTREIDLEALTHLTGEDLVRDFEIYSYAQRQAILKWIQKLRSGPRPEDPTAEKMPSQELWMAQLPLEGMEFPLSTGPIETPPANPGLCLLKKAWEITRNGYQHASLLRFLAKFLPEQRRFFLSHLPYSALVTLNLDPLISPCLDESVLQEALQKVNHQLAVEHQLQSRHTPLLEVTNLGPFEITEMRARLEAWLGTRLSAQVICTDELIPYLIGQEKSPPSTARLYTFSTEPVTWDPPLRRSQKGDDWWNPVDQVYCQVIQQVIIDWNHFFLTYPVQVAFDGERVVMHPQYHYSWLVGVPLPPPSPPELPEKWARRTMTQVKELPIKKIPLPLCYRCHQPFFPVCELTSELCLTCTLDENRRLKETCNLSGKVALITGGRAKIGYATALRLLRNGAQVIITTRCPKSALLKYQEEPDYDDWKERLEICQLDLRDLVGARALIEHLKKSYSRLDILINNAAQTTRHPAFYYERMEREAEAKLTGEAIPALEAPEASSELATLTKASVILEELPLTLTPEAVVLPEDSLAHYTPEELATYFPEGKNRFGEPLDLRPTTSWMMELPEIPMLEFLEVQRVNVTIPFLLIKDLIPLMKAHPDPSYVINVTAKEGQFYVRNKPTTHVHTNVAKAGLNMMVRTSAPQLAKEGIYLTAVGTSFVSNSTPGLHDAPTPMSPEYASNRLMHPIFEGENRGNFLSGKYYVQYEEAPW